MLAGIQSAARVADTEKIKNLQEVEFQVYSQFGEDGIIEWIVSRLQCEDLDIPRMFVEFGVEDYKEANTIFLLRHRNWSGLVMDADDVNIKRVRESPLYWRHDLRAVATFITRETVNDRFRAAGVPEEIGLLSIDIDGNDYWAWEAIDCTSPWIVVCEFNAVLGDLHPVSIPYRPDFSRAKAHFSHLYAGCSIAALRYLASKKGYVLLGSNSAGNNAFFARADIASPLTTAIAEVSVMPSRFREARGPDGRFTFVGGEARSRLIAQLPLLRVDTGDVVTLEQLVTIDSSRWQRLMGWKCG